MRFHSPGVAHFTTDHIIGLSPQMLDLKETLLKIAPRNSNVLITGESGTGKELFARALHAASLRRAGPFVKINCAAIPDTLVESELFGYEEGAFTGCRKGGQPGKLELAHQGTVFLDEVAELSWPMQAKLLRFLQEREIQKLGSRRSIYVDVRVVAATNVNLEQMVKYKKFREDLFYRLNVINLHIPPLRERKEDIPLLVEAFIQKFNLSFKARVSGVAPEVMNAFMQYSWPGNVRELENCLERAFNLIDDNKVIQLHHLPAHLYSLSGEKQPLRDTGLPGQVTQAFRQGKTLVEILEQVEKYIILQALVESKGNRARAARLLGISRPGLYKKLVKYNLM
ncbi:sigma-54 interaction domain-containing protein [Desulfofundulus thermocisternus]|uniref:sigma-54 interaction domain-containing protein n=1 Tax=Desulfofundulus thermocisternus TaxID=42471 RepID=UPI000692097C|nr:sigma-54-dependent Fis family transcriptional regulator [Desulfofundulus thermocisternus]